MEYLPLAQVCQINMGQSPESLSYNDKGDGLPFFQGNADFGEINPVTRVWCSAPTKIAQKDDILISVRAPIGAMNYASEECCIGRGLAAITPDISKVSSEFIYWLLKSKNTELNSKGTGSTFKAIGKKVLEEVRVPNITLEQQIECATMLMSVYEIIRLRQKQLFAFDTLIKARFVEMFGSEQETDRWPNCVVADVADVTVGVVIQPTQYYCEQGIPAFRSLNVREMAVNDSDWVFFTEEGHAKNPKSTIRENDVLVVRSGAPGVACVATAKYAGYNAVDIIIAHPHMEKVNPVFLAMFTNMPHGMNQIRAKTGGAAQQHYNIGGYKALKLMLPPLALQCDFAAFVSQVDKSKVIVQKALDESKLLLDSLMQKYFD